MSWIEFLARHGARIAEGGSSEIPGFGEVAYTAGPAENFLAPLTDLGLIAATGEDAPSFLHNQVSNDVEHLGAHEARLAAYCSPKGRMLASLLIWKTGDAIMLQMPRDIQAAVQKRLQMFVLRSKVKLTDVSERHPALGLAGKAAQNALKTYFPELPDAPYRKIDTEAGTLLRLADVQDMPRYQWITSEHTAQAVWPALSEALRPAGPALWRLTDIRTGIPRITQATQEKFVPQMINFELIGGVNFKKGCYPGQEIVARTQYLGKLKRRVFLASVASDRVAAGDEVFSSADPGQPCGMIVNAEASDQDRVECLVEMKAAALEEGTIHLGSAQGPALSFHPLPYSMTDPA